RHDAGADHHADPFRVLVLHGDAGVLQGQAGGTDPEPGGPTHDLERLPHGVWDERRGIDILDFAPVLDGERRGVEGRYFPNAATSVDAGVPEIVLPDPVWRD